MAQISKKYLSEDIQNKISGTLMEAVSQVKGRQDTQLFLNDLLTPTERVVLAKRLAIAVLLIKGWGYLAIQNFLKVSSDTVGKVSQIVKNNRGYRRIVERMLRTEAGRQFWQDVIKLVHRLGTRDTFVEEELLNKKLGIKKKNLL
ncbi:MAG TPA: Trp family transcriptional regulator [Chthoniobacterales bacterium]|nr:Trp family transcriptional regulator [Chthoniobacterales bacterium]